MFYRKYRPQKFSEISKPNEISEALLTQLKNKKTAQSYLFFGSRGTGKTTTARILAKALNCSNPEKDGDPCDKCSSCIAVKNGSFLDLIEIDAASNRGIDDIRELKDKIRLAPSEGKQKIYIIDEVHMLTLEAFNALLKTLEEPPKHITFILCTTELNKVPETIKSRCQVFKFKRASVSQIIIRLKNICKLEEAVVSDEDLKKIAYASAGGFRDADTMLQQVIESGISVDAFLGFSNKQSYINFLQFLLEKDIKSAVGHVNNLFQDGADLYVWSIDLLKFLRDLLFISTESYEGLIDVTDDSLDVMKKQATSISKDELVKLINLILKANNSIKNSIIPQLPLELAIIEFCSQNETGHFIEKPSPKPELNGPKPSVKASTVVNTTKVKNDTVETTKKTELKVEKVEVEIETKAELNEDYSDISNLKIDLEEVKENWEKVLKGVVAQNSSIQALLKSSKPIKTEGSSIILEVFYSFHKERLEHPKNRKIIEGVFKEVLGIETHIKCTVSMEKPANKGNNVSGVLTDYNVSSPIPISDPALEGSILEVFDGGLPLAASRK